MRNGQNKRMRNRNRRSQNPLSRVFESTGPDVKIRGTATQVAEKYVQLARDAQSSGDPVAAENYYQHAEHYFRIIASAQEQLRQTQPFYRNESDYRDDADADDGDGETDAGQGYSGEPTQPPREQPQPRPREAQPFPQRAPQPHHRRDSSHDRGRSVMADEEETVERLPSFITGGAAPAGNGGERPQGNDRYAHRRRRRPHGSRPEGGNAPQPAGGDDYDHNANPQGD